jgi:N-acetyl-gamma-glutamyl-phosphate reductase common form
MGATVIKAVVLGATGYVGGEFLRLLAAHPVFDMAAAVSRGQAGAAIGAAFPHLAAAYPDAAFTEPAKALEGIDTGSRLAVFSAAPHGASAALVAATLEAAAARNLQTHVVDCSADFRYADAAAYERVYGGAHGAPRLLGDFHCALPEHAGTLDAPHVGHPGCFATAVLLAAMPLTLPALACREVNVTAVTGSTGSGKTAQAGTHHPERHSNLYAYKPLSHRHVPEVERLLAARSGKTVKVHFVPHSGPFARGIYATLQAAIEPSVSQDDVADEFRSFYAESEFVRIVEGAPKLKDVVASNYAHIGAAADSGRVVVTCAIDNLVKGAAGGAVQWMNRLWSLPEATGLHVPAPAWT